MSVEIVKFILVGINIKFFCFRFCCNFFLVFFIDIELYNMIFFFFLIIFLVYVFFRFLELFVIRNIIFYKILDIINVIIV